ncbi:pleckstrin -like proteiny domain-containing family protein [Capsicum annuum]|nr:pleckstrin -like proteiny domain-containing family protein [Capsicum annuum]
MSSFWQVYAALYSMRSRSPSAKRDDRWDKNMSTEKAPLEQTSPVVASSCRKKKSESATFLEDVKDHIDEFIHASMDEHKSCFKKTIQKMFGMSKVVAERNAEPKEVESSLPLRTVVSE